MKKKNFYLFLFFSSSLLGSEVKYFARSPEALVLGDAYTARADDEYSLFYNPAALARTKGLSLTPINPNVGVTNALGDLDRFKNLPTKAQDFANRFLDYPVYLQAGAFPSVKMAGFGFSLFLNSTTNAVLRNAVHPMIDVDYRYDRGFSMGYAYSWGTAGVKKRKKDRPSDGYRTSVGFGVKHIRRTALYNQFDIFSTEIINTIANSKDFEKFLRDLGYSEGSAWGFDFGMEHRILKSNTETAFGFSILDIGGTRFSKRISGTGVIPTQEMTVNLGTSFKQDFKVFDYTLSADVKPLNQYLPLSRRLHVGAEFGFPFLKAFTGWSEGYISYGLSTNLYVFKLTAGFYNTEIGSGYKEQKGKRAIIYLSLFDFSFDA